MISYKIIVQNTTDQRPSRLVVKPGDPGFKEVVFQRNLSRCRWKIGDRVKVRRSSKRGTIKEIITTFDEVAWEHNKPKFIVVDFDGQLLRCDYSQLKGSKL